MLATTHAIMAFIVLDWEPPPHSHLRICAVSLLINQWCVRGAEAALPIDKIEPLNDNVMAFCL